MMGHTLQSDGSAEADARNRVIINRESEADRWRYRCPNNHTRWSPTNNHIYCTSCASQSDPGDGPEYWTLLDTKTGKEIPWSRVVFR